MLKADDRVQSRISGWYGTVTMGGRTIAQVLFDSTDYSSKPRAVRVEDLLLLSRPDPKALAGTRQSRCDENVKPACTEHVPHPTRFRFMLCRKCGSGSMDQRFCINCKKPFCRVCQQRRLAKEKK